MGTKVIGAPRLRRETGEEPGGATNPSRPAPTSSSWGGWWVLGWFLPLAVQLLHAAVVAPAYHVGSFDDDANYLMAAHVLANGGGLTTHMPSGVTVVANYLPGYPVLLVPLIWLFGAALWPPARALGHLRRRPLPAAVGMDGTARLALVPSGCSRDAFGELRCGDVRHDGHG